MFFGYYKARRGGLSKKDFLPRSHLLNPLRILLLRSSNGLATAASEARCPHLRHDIMDCGASLPAVSRLERHEVRFVWPEPGTFLLV